MRSLIHVCLKFLLVTSWFRIAISSREVKYFTGVDFPTTAHNCPTILSDGCSCNLQTQFGQSGPDSTTTLIIPQLSSSPSTHGHEQPIHPPRQETHPSLDGLRMNGLSVCVHSVSLDACKKHVHVGMDEHNLVPRLEPSPWTEAMMKVT